MNREQAEAKAHSYNAVRPATSPIHYMAYPMARTKWEKDRWGVVQLYGTENPNGHDKIGIAAL